MSADGTAAWTQRNDGCASGNHGCEKRVDDRRAMLASLTIDLPSIDLATITPTPFWQNGLDWFATPDDVVAIHAALAALSDADVAAALTTNPGVIVDAEAWPVVAYKGGSSLGVVDRQLACGCG